MNQYRLIQVIESVDNITKSKIDIFELTPVSYNSDSSEYNFNTLSSTDNDFFIYDNSEMMESFFMSHSNEIIELDIIDFEMKLINTPEGLRKTYFSKKLSELRNNKS